MSEIWNGLQELIAGLMALIYQVVPSFGLTIIILTIIINILVFPLTLKQTRSSRAMQEIQPEMKKLQKKYKEDPETLQKETMALYRERGVNPIGCLFPLLVQFPIWIALFQVLRSLEHLLSLLDPTSRLYQELSEGLTGFLGLNLIESASAVLSAEGLLAALPYFFLILVVVVSQYIQQRMLTPNPETQDRQARQMQSVMKIMPLFFGFISYNLPAGLVLYFATSNIFRIGQQQLIFKIDGRPEPPSAKKEETDPKPTPKRPQGSAKKRNRRRRK